MRLFYNFVFRVRRPGSVSLYGLGYNTGIGANTTILLCTGELSAISCIILRVDERGTWSISSTIHKREFYAMSTSTSTSPRYYMWQCVCVCICWMCWVCCLLWSGLVHQPHMMCVVFFSIARVFLFLSPVVVVAHLMNNLSIHLVQYVSVSIDWFCLRD